MAVNKDLVDYITHGLETGKSESSLKMTLLGQGWHEQDVDDSMRAARSARPAPGSVPRPTPGSGYGPQARQVGGEPGIVESFKMIITSPTQFFNTVKHHDNFGPSFKYYAVISLFTAVIYGAMMAIGIQMILGSLIDTFQTMGGSATAYGSDALSLVLPFMLMMIPVGYLMGLVFIFIGAGLMHICVYIFGGRRGYVQTFKAVVYSMTPGVIATMVYVPILFLLISGGLENVELIVNILYPLNGVMLIFSVWAIYLEARGFSVFHEVSFLRGLIMALSPFLFALLIAMVMFGGLFFALGAFNPAAWSNSRVTGFANLGTPPDWIYMSDGGLSITVQNSLSTPITISRVSARCGTTGSDQELSTSSSNVVGPGETVTYVTTGCEPLTSGQTYSVPVTVSYTREGTTYQSIDTGTITGTAV